MGGWPKDIHYAFFGNVVRGKSALFRLVVRNGFVHFVRKVFGHRKLLPGKFGFFAPLPMTPLRNFFPLHVCTLPFPLEFEAEINESVALMARNGPPEWEGGPSQRVPIPMADSGHLLQGTKGDEGENKLIFLTKCQKSKRLSTAR